MANESMKAPLTNQGRDAGIDILKAVCIMLVVLWHCQPIKASMFPGDHSALMAARQVIHFFYFNISLLAVPSFILVSLYLFIGKMSETEDYWKKRFLKLTQIYVFWVGIQFVLYLLMGGGLPLPLKTIIRSGGPDLPFSSFMSPAPSIFYFLFVLILCTVLTFFFLKLPDKVKLALSVIVIGASCVYFYICAVKGISIDTRSMKNYYVYIPVAYCLYRYQEEMLKFRALFLIGFILSIVAELSLGWRTPPYGRLSIFFGSLFLMSVFISGWTVSRRPVRLLSQYSLGIFALHGYFMVAVFGVYALLQGQNRVLPVQSIPESILLFAVIFSLTCLCIWLMAKTKLRIYVS